MSPSSKGRSIESILTDFVEVGFILLNSEGHVSYVNDWVSRSSGVDREDMEGQLLDRIFPELTGSPLMDMIQKALSAGQTGNTSHSINDKLFPFFSFDEGAKKREAVEQHIKVRPIVSEKGERMCFVQVQDVTQSARREVLLIEKAREMEDFAIALKEESSDWEERYDKRTKELVSAEHRLEDAIETLPAGFAIFDWNDEFVLANNPYSKALSDFGVDLIPGMTFKELQRELLAKGYYNLEGEDEGDWLTRRSAYHRYPSESFEVKTHAGRYLRIYEGRTREGGYVTIVTDVTNVKKRDQSIHQSQKMEAVGHLTGGVAHDFNNLLTLILGNIEDIEDIVEDGKGDIGLPLKAAKKAALRGADLTQRLLVFSRRQELVPVNIGPNSLVESTLPLLNRTMGGHVELVTSYDDNVPDVKVDEGQLENAVVNLVVHAKERMPEGGKVAISTNVVTLDAADVADIPKLEKGRYVSISVTDSGPSMSAEDIEKAFELVYDETVVDDVSNMILPMVYGFATQSGGGITIVNNDKFGVKVSLLLPLMDEPEVKDVTSARKDRAKKTILVVEDEHEVRNMAERILARLGYEVLTARDGVEAIRLLREKAADVDLVFSDVLMPGGVSGIALAQHVEEQYPDIPVLLTSGFAGNANDVEGEMIGGRSIIWKPYRRADLDNAVSGVFGAVEEV